MGKEVGTVHGMTDAKRTRTGPQMSERLLGEKKYELRFQGELSPLKKSWIWTLSYQRTRTRKWHLRMNR
jgi:hypothetical protein